MDKQQKQTSAQPNEGLQLDRRNFFKLAAATGLVAAAGTAATGCAPSAEGGKGAETAGTSNEFDAYAEPIMPETPPEKWTEEADVVVVGGSAGGLVAAIKMQNAGKNVILVEKGSATGGISAESTIFMNYGGHKRAEEAEWAFPSYPYDPNKIVEYLMNLQGLGGDPLLYKSMAVAGPVCIDWMNEELGAKWVPMNDDPVNSAYLIWEGSITPHNIYRTNVEAMEFFDNLARNCGVTILTDTEVLTLVKDESRVLGVKASSPDGEIYIKGNEGVLLTAGGFALNRAMVKKYCPTIFPGIANYYPPPYDTGECVRMGIGAGADMAGINTAGVYDGGIDWGVTEEDDLQFTVHSVFDGATAAVRQPWLTIDALGNRVPFFSYSVYPYLNHAQPGVLAEGLEETGAVQITRFGGRSYVCFDSKFEEYTKGNKLFHVKLDRMFIETPADDSKIDRIPEDYRDWRNGFNQAVEAGAIKKCDTIEELEKELGLNEGVLVNAVAKWNEACKAGEDNAECYKLEPEWLKALENPPYYGAKIGGNIFATKAGLRVTPQMEVIGTDGLVIPGLYAGFHTAGGHCGENNITSRSHGGRYGCVGASFISGFIAASTILGEKI